MKNRKINFNSSRDRTLTTRIQAVQLTAQADGAQAKHDRADRTQYDKLIAIYENSRDRLRESQNLKLLDRE